MTIITIKQQINGIPSEFLGMKELSDFVFDYYQNQELPPLNLSEREEAEKVAQEWKNNPQNFSRALGKG